MAQTARWTVEVSKETDEAVRRDFDRTLAAARDAFADLPPDELEALLDAALAAARG